MNRRPRNSSNNEYNHHHVTSYLLQIDSVQDLVVLAYDDGLWLDGYQLVSTYQNLYQRAHRLRVWPIRSLGLPRLFQLHL